jgi:2-aminoethylphosphonate dioxygenase
MSTQTAAATIDAAQIAQYHTDGFVVVRNVFAVERITELQAEAERLRQRVDLIDTDNIRCRWQNEVDTGECRFDCFDPVIDLSDVCARAAREPRLLDIVSSLYGEPACLFKDKLIFKAPGHAGLQPPSGLHLLEDLPDFVRHGDRGDRRS